MKKQRRKITANNIGCLVIIIQNMLQSDRLENLRDLEKVRFQELMESIPNSIHQFSSPKDISGALKKTSPNIQISKTRKKVHKPAYIYRQNQSEPQIEHLQSLPDRSTRSLFQRCMSSDLNGFFPEGQGKLDCHFDSNQRGENIKIQNSLILKDLITKYKIKSIVSTFVNKIKRISVSNKPVEFRREEQHKKGLLWRETCIQLPQVAQNIFSLLSISQIIILSIAFSMSMVFVDIRKTDSFRSIQIFSFLIFLLEFLQNLFTVRSTAVKKIKVLNELWKTYAEGSLATDALTLLIVLLNCMVNNQYVLYCETVIFFKLPQVLDRMERLEVYWIKNFYNEQYWSLAKIIISNFCFAHAISIALAGMTNLSPGQNWMTQKGIKTADWEEQYIWSYYWASTIMLTIGFGDIVASNSKEALCLIFIETFSCLVFAYNINCIGTLIQHIRSQDAQKSRRSKIFKKLTKQNNLNEELSWKINNYIEENAQLRKRFNFQEQKEFIVNLPVELKKQYLKESNKKIFQHIQFFKSFMSKTLYNLAEKIEMRVSHPNEVIQRIDDDYNLIILKQGQVGYFCKKATFTPKDYLMNIKNLCEKDNPYLLSLDFVLRKRPYYEIRSIQYSIFFFLNYNDFIEAVKDSSMDYQFYCGIRDKTNNIPDEFQLMKCDTCEGAHLKAYCPRLHFIPYNQMVIYKYLHKEKTSKNEKIFYRRGRKEKANAFKIYKMASSHVNKLGAMVTTKRRRQDIIVALISEDGSDFKQTSHSIQIEVEREIKKIQEKYFNFTYEIIKQEINKIKKSEFEQDEVWLLQVDKLHDFNNYFSKDNPVSIESVSLEPPQNFNINGPLKGTVIVQHIKGVLNNSQKKQYKTRKMKTKVR